MNKLTREQAEYLIDTIHAELPTQAYDDATNKIEKIINACVLQEFKTIVYNYDDEDIIDSAKPIYGEISWHIGGIGASMFVNNICEGETLDITLHPNEMKSLRDNIDKILRLVDLNAKDN